jgi:hypothetical protein
VPTQAELQAAIPAGRLAVAVKPFMPPAPAFGPGSVEHVRRQAEALELPADEGAPTAPAAERSTYAGAGSYY